MGYHYKQNTPDAKILVEMVEDAIKGQQMLMILSKESYDTVEKKLVDNGFKPADNIVIFYCGMQVFMKENQKSECIIIDNPNVAKA
jgi:hypothetical protein